MSRSDRPARSGLLAKDPGIVGDDLAVGVEDGLIVVEGDLAGDGLDHAQDGGAALEVGLVGVGCAAVVVGADLVDEAGATAAGTGLFDEDFRIAEGDGCDGLVAEVDEVGRDEEEDEDEGDHHVVVDAAALVGPEEVAADEGERAFGLRWSGCGWDGLGGGGGSHLGPRADWSPMTVSPFM